MKKKLIAILTATCAALAFGNGQEQKRVFEQMSANMMALHVRVFNQGRPVAGLAAADFAISENGADKPIQAFNEKHAPLAPHLAAAQYRDPRLYALIFNVATTGPEINNALRFIFTRGMRPKDHLVVMANSFQVKDHVVMNPGTELESLLHSLEKTCSANRTRQIELENRLETESQEIQTTINNETDYDEILSRLEMFRTIFGQYLTEYRQNFLSVLQGPPQAYAGLASYLQTRSMDSAVIVFNQLNQFPVIRHSGALYRALRSLAQSAMLFATAGTEHRFQEIATEIENISLETKAVPEAGLDLFARVASLKIHSFLISPLDRSSMNDFDMKILGREAEQALRHLSARTGGVVVQGAGAEPLYASLCNLEDIYYELFYKPAPAPASGRNTVHVHFHQDEQSMVLSTQEMEAYFRALAWQRSRENHLLDVADLKVSDENRLEFVLSSYQRQGVDKALQGELVFRIRIRDALQKVVLDKEAHATPQNERERFSFGLPDDLPLGTYQIGIDIIDLLQKKTISAAIDYTVD
jgi:hypothetical protein